jgi:hypothetical protein
MSLEDDETLYSDDFGTNYSSSNDSFELDMMKKEVDAALMRLEEEKGS